MADDNGEVSDPAPEPPEPAPPAPAPPDPTEGASPDPTASAPAPAPGATQRIDPSLLRAARAPDQTTPPAETAPPFDAGGTQALNAPGPSAPPPGAPQPPIAPAAPTVPVGPGPAPTPFAAPTLPASAWPPPAAGPPPATPPPGPPYGAGGPPPGYPAPGGPPPGYPTPGPPPAYPMAGGPPPGYPTPGPPPGYPPAPGQPMYAGAPAPYPGAPTVGAQPGYGGYPPGGPPPGTLPPYAAAPAAAAPRRGAGKIVIGIICAFAVLVAGGFAIYSLAKPDGAGDPESAVRNLFTAIDQEDFVGVLETLPPSERAIIRDGMLDAIKNFQRLGLVSDFDAHKVPGTTFEVNGLQLASTQLSPDVVSVRVTGGTISGTTVPKDLPAGDLIRERYGNDIDKAKTETFTEDLAKDKLKFAAVKEGRGWHVSLFYSIADYIRRDSDPMPAFGQGPAPLGSDSPENAVRDMANAVINLDPDTGLRLLPPDEMRVLYDYSNLILPEARKGAESAKQRDNYSGKIDRLDLRAEGSGGLRRIFVTGFDGSVTAKYEDVRASYDGQCVKIDDTRHPPPGSDSGGSSSSSSSSSSRNRTTHDEVCRDGRVTSDGTTFDRSKTTVDPFAGLGSSTASFDLPITVVEVNGRWYVSPTRTLIDNLLTGLGAVKKDDIKKFLDSEWFNPRPYERYPSTGSGTVPPYTPNTTGRRSTSGTTTGTRSSSGGTSSREECMGTKPAKTSGNALRDEYLRQKAIMDCLERNGLPTYDLPSCYAAYEALPSDASDAEWDIATAKVSECIDREYGPDGSSPGTTTRRASSSSGDDGG